MEAAIRFSQNSLPSQVDQHFLKIDVTGRALQVYNITEEGKSKFKYHLVYSSNKLPPFRAFDWHPIEPGLVAVGQTGGEASLVNLTDPDQSPIAFTVRSPRSCNAIGLNTQNWLAAGLEKARNDFCLNIWDLNQRLSGASNKPYSKSASEPLQKLAGGEPITSLRFFQDQPKLLAAGVKGQFIRLYDLREPTSNSALQFPTRCVNNIAVDTQDENYFASCLPSNIPTVSIWDRRMVSRVNIAQVGFANYVGQAEQHPEVSAELKNVVDPQGQIWGLRYSKTKRGQLGVLSSTGQLRISTFGTEKAAVSSLPEISQDRRDEWEKQQPCATFVQDSQNFSNAWNEYPLVEETKRIVSFDFTTAMTIQGHAKVITLTGDGRIEVKAIAGNIQPHQISSKSWFFDAKTIRPTSNKRKGVEKDYLPLNSATDESAFRAFAFRGSLSQSSSKVHTMAQLHNRCEEGYLLDASINMKIVKNNEMLRVFWSWMKHAQEISAYEGMVSGGIDLSYMGVFGLWMEELDINSRATKPNSTIDHPQMHSIIRNLVQILNLKRGKSILTEYPHYRALCLHACGLPWTQIEVERDCSALVSKGEHTKAAAVALFASEEKVAQRALRSKGSERSHKMLAMALVGARNRHRRMRRNNSDNQKASDDDDSNSDASQDEEWREIVTAVAEDLTDCYARSILAYVKTGNWEDVVNEDCLPLRYRVYIALRHYGDLKLTQYLSSLKTEVIATANLEGILITGLGTPESIDLLQRYARTTDDIQTATLGMSFAGASDRFLLPHSPYSRTVHCFRKVYKTILLSIGLKLDKARFDVALARLLREHGVTHQPRPKEQIRLVCTHCNSSLAQFGHDQQVAEQNVRMTETAKHPLAPEKAAVAGVVCPRCGRHLPRCGVCNLWLGTPDETYSKWYKPQPRNSNSIDLSASVVGSTITAIGPISNTPSVSISGASRGAPNSTDAKTKVTSSMKLTSADVPNEAVEVVDEKLVKQQQERMWYEAMHQFVVYCVRCSHGFHADHARMWFDGVDGQEGHRNCPVPLCDCLCRG